MIVQMAGHGCIVMVDAIKVEKNMIVKPIIEDEYHVLEKFIDVQTIDNCEWYERILSII